jgi:hypothetical protein
MSDSNKKKVAAISAVMTYLRQEEEAYAFWQLNASNVNGVPISTQPQASSNTWGMSGRQAQMQTRSLMQLKALYRLN